jgi:hypothetical protein
MKLPFIIGRPIALAAIFTSATLVLDQETQQSLTPPPTLSEKGVAESIMGCHEMRLHHLGLFKEHRITMTDGQKITINQWLCPDQYKMTALQDLSAQSYPDMHCELWDKEGIPIAMSVTRKPM